jgi:hypothetical protein
MILFFCENRAINTKNTKPVDRTIFFGDFLFITPSYLFSFSIKRDELSTVSGGLFVQKF